MGDPALVQSSGGWYKARVLEVANGRYKVRYDGWGAAWDEWVGAERMRQPDGGTVSAPPSAPPSAPTAAPAAAPTTPVSKPATGSSTPKAPAPAGSTTGDAANAATAYGVGDQVWVYWTGTSHRASILQARDGQYLIRYDGYDSRWDEWVGPGRIGGRVQGSAAPAGARSGAAGATGSSTTAPQTGTAAATAASRGSPSPVGKWECTTWDYGQRNRIGGFTLEQNGSYRDLNSGKTGRYTFDKAKGRIAFTSGPQQINVPITFQPDAHSGTGMITFDYGGGARLDCYRAAR
ncbi:MAG TPA: Tudor-knot domain-containing protein [Gemmatimonadales bacterium]